MFWAKWALLTWFTKEAKFGNFSSVHPAHLHVCSSSRSFFGFFVFSIGDDMVGAKKKKGVEKVDTDEGDFNVD